jgi:hypothetical protein
VNGCQDSGAAGIEIYDWTPNVCSAQPGTSPAPGESPVNPAFGIVDCQPTAAAGIEPGLYWMAVGYESFACSSAVAETPTDYVRGCVNECAELTVAACPNYDPTTPAGSERYQCDDESRTAFGRLECGCGRNYGGANCEIGCPGDGTLTSEDFSIETRSGYWMCGRVLATSGERLSGNGYTLDGYVPLAPADGAELESEDGRYTLRSR